MGSNVYNESGATDVHITAINQTAANLASDLDACQIGFETDTYYLHMRGVSTTHYKFPWCSSVLAVNDVPRWVAATGLTAGVMHDTGSALGVGVTSPDRLHHVEVSDAGTVATVYAQRISHISSETPAAGFGTGWEIELETAAAGTNHLAGAIECYWTDAAVLSSAGQLAFSTGAVNSLTRKMEITSAGNVGINCANPLAQIETSYDGTKTFIGPRFCQFSDTPTDAPTVRIYHARGTRAAPTKLVSGDTIGTLAFQGYDTGASNGGWIRALAAANWGDSATDAPTDIYIACSPNASDTPVNVAMFASTGYMHTASRLMVGSLTVAPQSLLHVYAGASGTTPLVGHVTIEDLASTYLNILVPNASIGGLRVWCPASNVQGEFLFTTHASSANAYWSAKVGGLETLRIGQSYATIPDDTLLCFGTTGDGYIEYDENGGDVHIVVLKLPTSNSGLAAGQLWNSNGSVMISAGP